MGAPTDWASISPNLLEYFADVLPSVPTLAEATAQFGGVEFPFPFSTFKVYAGWGETKLSADGIRVDAASVACNASWSALEAGARYTCKGDPWKGDYAYPDLSCGTSPSRGACLNLPWSSKPCPALLWSHDIEPAIQITSKFHGTSGYAGATAGPHWIQMTFPAVPAGAASVSLRFRQDTRYRPSLYGGNPCLNASATHNCTLCVSGPWDHSVPAGLRMLWSVAGRSDYVITEPLTNLMEAWDAGEFMQTVTSPSSLTLAAGDYPVVAFLVFNQYPAPANAHSQWQRTSGNDGCELGKDVPAGLPRFTNTLWLFNDATIFYRQSLSLPSEPPDTRPRLYGDDTTWVSTRVEPFTSLPCNPDSSMEAGFLGQPGLWDAKTYYETSAYAGSFHSCDNHVYNAPHAFPPHGDIWQNSGAMYYAPDAVRLPRYEDSERALHLLRRLWACAKVHGDYTTCEHSGHQTALLAAAVSELDMRAFLTVRAGYVVNFATPLSWACYAEPCFFDLWASAQVEFWSLWYDTMSSQPGVVSAANLTLVADGLLGRINLYRQQFHEGHWSLWNGNNWNLGLSNSALRWAVAFWYEQPEVARDVVGIVNDILWLHFPSFYKDDGTPVEGVSYSQLSIDVIADLVSQHRISFGATPAVVSSHMEQLEKLAKLHLASVDGNGVLVDFGDSHPTAGARASTILAAAFGRIISGNLSIPLSIDACDARKLNAVIYGSYGRNPWTVDPVLAPLTSEFATMTAECAHVVDQPLGSQSMQVFPDGGYAVLRVPLLAPNASVDAPCFGTLCVHQTKPSVTDLIPYGNLALQARDALWSKSELDFGTLVWSAWGQRLLSEFGYGSMSHIAFDGDYRRVEYLDNGPVGHNTIVVNEAFQEENEEVINFSQLTGASGDLLVSNTTSRDGDTGECLLLDGSAVYGSLRPDGWLDVMRRYACPIGAAFVLVDVLATKAAREPLVIQPGWYGGPGFDEGGSGHSRLHLEEYFHTDTAAEMSSSGTPMSPNGASTASFGGVEMPFDTPENPRATECSHVDVAVHADGAEVVLRPKCGLMKGRPPDGLGLVSGFAVAGGRFEYDGLVTTENAYLTAHAVRKRRFRFLGNGSIGSEGDVRAFVLAPSPADNRSAVPVVRMTSCSELVGCGAQGEPIQCSCVELCTEQTLRWIIINNGRLVALHIVGACDAEFSSPDAALVERATLVALGPWEPSASPTLSPSTTPTTDVPSSVPIEPSNCVTLHAIFLYEECCEKDPALTSSLCNDTLAEFEKLGCCPSTSI